MKGKEKKEERKGGKQRKGKESKGKRKETKIISPSTPSTVLSDQCFSTNLRSQALFNFEFREPLSEVVKSPAS